MTGQVKHIESRLILREKIIEVASDLFSKNGIKSITMDEIAASLGISKRTLYEVFSDKETLLVECIWKEQEKNNAFLKEVMAASDNALEMLLKCYQHSIEKFQATNKKFFEDIKKYPQAQGLLKKGSNRDSEDTIKFFHQG